MKYRTWLVIIIVFLMLCISGVIDNHNSKTSSINSVHENEAKKNYDAIITIIDGEGEATFTEVWGDLIKSGYPICSSLVIDYVGKDGFMDWQTIESLNNIGVEFEYHSSSHLSYANANIEEIEKDIERGIEIMDEHKIEHRAILWRSGTQIEKCEIGKRYFDCGFTDKNSTNSIIGENKNLMMIMYVLGSNNNNYYSYEQLKQLIDESRYYNGWLVIYTRNNHKMMDETQIDIYRQAFEYAKEHNVAVVTASEGYDLYYGNKLGNH